MYSGQVWHFRNIYNRTDSRFGINIPDICRRQLATHRQGLVPRLDIDVGEVDSHADEKNDTGRGTEQLLRLLTVAASHVLAYLFVICRSRNTVSLPVD